MMIRVCKYEEYLEAYVSTGTPNAAEIERHLPFCSACRATVSALRTMTGILTVSGRQERARAFAASAVPALFHEPKDEWYRRVAEDIRFVSIEAVWAMLGEADRVSEERPRQAVSYYDLAVFVAEEIALTQAPPSEEFRVAAWKDLAWCLRRVGEYGRAEHALEKAEQACANCADRAGMLARVALSRGILYTSMERFDEALQLIGVAKDEFRRLGDAERVDMAIEQEANILIGRNDGTGALRSLMALMTEPADDHTRARRYGNLAIAFELAGSLPSARQFLRKARDIHARAGASFLLHKDSWALGRILWKEGRVDDALSTLTLAAEGFRELENVDSAVLVDLLVSEIELSSDRTTAATYDRLRTAAAYSIEKHMPESACRALLFLQQLGKVIKVAHIEYVSEFIRDLREHPHREFVPPIAA
jgi:tetratricopeptide (TPR) repeat protein